MTFDQMLAIISERKRQAPAGSYVASLFAAGPDRIIQKFGEEAIETVIAAKNSDRAELISESADLIFHFLVLLAAQDLTLDDIRAELTRRHEARANSV